MKTIAKIVLIAVIMVTIFFIGRSKGNNKPDRFSFYRGEEVSRLISHRGFLESAQASPEFMRDVLMTVSRLELEYEQAKEQARYCPKCREEMRQRIKARALPPPPLPE